MLQQSKSMDTMAIAEPIEAVGDPFTECVWKKEKLQICNAVTMLN